MCSNRGCESKIVGEMLQSSLKNKSGSYFLEKNFQPADYKSLRLGSAAVKTQFSYGVWGSPSKRPPTVYAKTVCSLLREST